MTERKRVRNLRDLRRYHGYTLVELSNLLGISKSYASYIENGKRRLTLDNAAKLARIYGADIDFIYRLAKRTEKKAI